MTNEAANRVEREIERLHRLFPSRRDPTPEPLDGLLQRLDNPERRLAPVIHVSGANGKGSAAAFCRALLEASGHAVHVHAAPHLVQWRESYRLGVKAGRGRLVQEVTLAEVLARVIGAAQGLAVTPPEILTTAAFLLFAENPADAVVIEAGSGGRFDAANRIADPAVSLVMPILPDRQAWPGDDIEVIAAAATASLKRRRPAVFGRQPFEAALDVLVSAAERQRCPYWVYGQDFSAHEEFGRMVYQDETGLADLPLPALAGRHQIANAAAAIRAVRAAGFILPDEAVEQAMLAVEWPARMQRVVEGNLLDGLPKGAEIWLDGGHNPGAAEAMAEVLAGLEERDPRPLHLVCGMSNAEDALNYFRAFEGLAGRVFTVPVVDLAESADPVALASTACDAGLTGLPMGGLEQALDEIRAAARDPDRRPPRILICGSLKLAGEALTLNGTPPQ